MVLSPKEGTPIGLAILGHSKNPQTSWNMNPGLRFMSASVTTVQPTVVEKGHPLVLSYRLVTHDGAPPKDTLDNLAHQFYGGE
jgi:hypothetical protein